MDCRPNVRKRVALTLTSQMTMVPKSSPEMTLSGLRWLHAIVFTLQRWNRKELVYLLRNFSVSGVYLNGSEFCLLSPPFNADHLDKAIIKTNGNLAWIGWPKNKQFKHVYWGLCIRTRSFSVSIRIKFVRWVNYEGISVTILERILIPRYRYTLLKLQNL